jgi:hypothetical protein
MVELGKLNRDHWGFRLGGRDIMTAPDEKRMRELDTLKDALDLVTELWPKPGYRSITIETHQWVKLRRVLLAIPDLVASGEDDA